MYFESIFQIFEDVIRNALATHKDAKQISIQSAIRPVISLEIDSVALKKTTLTQAMRTALNQSIRVSSDKL